MAEEEEQDIVIVGGGICGLATALALHRIGITRNWRVVVLERAESLRAGGAAISIFTNGWRALHQLGLASNLRSTALPIHTMREISLDDNSVQEISIGEEELRCLKRGELIERLANSLPHGMIRFGCQVLTVKWDPLTSCPVVHLQDGSIVKSKAVIGCDGANSVVAEFIGLSRTSNYSTRSIVGFTNYPNGHSLKNESIRIRRGSVSVGRIPMDDNLVYWFVGLEWTTRDSNAPKDLGIIKKSAMESVEAFPAEIAEMIKKSELNSLSLARLQYRAPWDILFGNFRKGTVTVAGDAMHVMGPFLGQGGSAALEDAIVIARFLAQNISVTNIDGSKQYTMSSKTFEAALDQYLKERKMRLVWLATQSYIIGLLSKPSSVLVCFLCLLMINILFRDSLGHARYDCGHL